MLEYLKKLLPKRLRNQDTMIPMIKLQGTIMSGGGQFRPTLNLANVDSILEKAFAFKDAPAVAIAVNSPGGSPVQSRLIFQRIRQLAQDKNKKVLIFVEDVAASGGYMIALAGDEIFADPTSIVGSIGVVSGGFGFPELLKKIGVERRVYTAGENKVILDPFQPEKEKDIEYLKSLQLEIHQVFIDMVKERRAHKLADNETVFSGLFWSGTRSLELGLIDGLSDMQGEIRRRYGDKAKLKLVSAKRGWFGARFPAISSFSAENAVSGLSAGLVETMEEKALWGRYGL